MLGWNMKEEKRLEGTAARRKRLSESIVLEQQKQLILLEQLENRDV